MEVEAQDILPVEIWTRILYLLPLHNWRLIQNVCSLFWNIVQHFVALGLIKSDFYDIKRPFKEASQPSNLDVPSYFIFSNQESLMFQGLKPNWLLGVSVHGPYTYDNVSLKNLIINIFVKVDNHILVQRVKQCKVKIPSVVLPIFFDKPLLLHSHLNYEIVVQYIMSQPPWPQDMPEYVIEYNKIESVTGTINGDFIFHQPMCIKDDTPSQFAYSECGQIRHLYLWPRSRHEFFQNT